MDDATARLAALEDIVRALADELAQVRARAAEHVIQLEARVGQLEDVIAIYGLVSMYGPSVDSNSRAVASGLWTEDGEYNVNPGGAWVRQGGFDIGSGVWKGRGEIEGMIGAPSHQSRLAAGCAHQVSFPHVRVDGDRAVATGYQTLIMHQDGGYRIDRQSANRWELARTAEGWRVVKRTNRLLDGSEEARALLAQGAAESVG